jgi:hypothetical protein
MKNNKILCWTLIYSLIIAINKALFRILPYDHAKFECQPGFRIFRYLRKPCFVDNPAASLSDLILEGIVE